MHGDGFLRANAGLATAVLGGPTFPITECNKGNKVIQYAPSEYHLTLPLTNYLRK